MYSFGLCYLSEAIDIKHIVTLCGPGKQNEKNHEAVRNSKGPLTLFLHIYVSMSKGFRSNLLNGRTGNLKTHRDRLLTRKRRCNFGYFLFCILSLSRDLYNIVEDDGHGGRLGRPHGSDEIFRRVVGTALDGGRVGEWVSRDG